MHCKFQLVVRESGVLLEIFDGARKTTVPLTSYEVDDLIAGLASVRKDLLPEVPRVLPDGTHSEVQVDPIWAGATCPPRSERVLAVRHPGLGWLLFVLPESSARPMAAYLTRGSIVPKNDPSSLRN